MRISPLKRAIEAARANNSRKPYITDSFFIDGLNFGLALRTRDINPKRFFWTNLLFLTHYATLSANCAISFTSKSAKPRLLPAKAALPMGDSFCSITREVRVKSGSLAMS